MEHLRNLVENFCNNSRYLSNIEYQIRFCGIVVAMLDFLTEELIDSRDARDTNEFYTLIFEDLLFLREHVNLFSVFLMNTDELD